MKPAKSVKIKAQEAPEFHVYVYCELDKAQGLVLEIQKLAQIYAGHWSGDGTDGKVFDISFVFKSQINASVFLEEVKKLPISEVSLNMWDGNNYKDVPTLH